QASTISSINSRTGDLGWRQVLSPEDTILATSLPPRTHSSSNAGTATVSSGGRVVRLWSPADGSMIWETFLGRGGDPPSTEQPEAPPSESSAAGVVSTEGGYVVVLSAGGIHVLSASSGAVLGQ
ncbi:unnamed protein product, partial [Ectocarpus sp. 8 AP-2014]